MASGPTSPLRIGVVTLSVALGLLVVTEAAAWWLMPRVEMHRLAMLGLTRLFQVAALLLCVFRLEGSLAAIGWAPADWRPGVIKGAVWSLGFALAAALGMAVIFLAGLNPLLLLKTPLPAGRLELILLFLVGGLVGPLAEEICFRGVLYTFFRRWGVWAALLFSTAIFVALHSVSGIPVTQIVGGVVFALAFETSRNLMVPITVHVLGNCAIFALSLPMFH